MKLLILYSSLLESWNSSVVYSGVFLNSFLCVAICLLPGSKSFCKQNVAQSGSLKTDGLNPERGLRRSLKVLETAQD